MSPASRIPVRETARLASKLVGTPGFLLAVAVALFCLVGFGREGARVRDELQLAGRRAVRVAELRGTISQLDELLTMSARMAAASGDPAWVARYDEAEPRLDAAIVEAVALATPDVAAELARTTDEANRALVAMERHSFARLAEGDLAGARALLEDPEYARLKAVYASGVEAFGRGLYAFAAARADDFNQHAWMAGAGLALCAVLLVAAALTARGNARLRAALARTEAVARRDVLTGLPNRLSFREHVERVLPGTSGDCPAALLYLDLDGFKAVNDTLGHPVGDELLRAAAARLRECARGADLVARLGGDEFAIVQVDGPQPREAAALADRVIAAMGAPFALGGQSVVIGASVGIALSGGAPDGGNGTAADEMLRTADLALYRAKAAGRGAWRLFEPGMDAEAQARRALEAGLRLALAGGEFEVFYQPLVETGTRALAGFEALLRWNHPVRGMVPPAEFVPVAEEIGLIGAIGAWVLERACADAASWPAHLTVAVNLSPAQFLDGDLVRGVERALAGAGLPASRLELEITESVLLRDNHATLGILHRLRGMGARIAMDDFGTGYSSLSYLRRFPFDGIKIDQSFVRNLGSEKGGVEIIRAVVGLGHALGMRVLAEGVETAEQLAVLRDEGCDKVQGYLLGRPTPLADVPVVIEAFPTGDRRDDHAAGRRGAAAHLALVRGQS